MQNESRSLFKLTPQIISNKFHQLFEESATQVKEPGLMNPQPSNQRWLFLNHAIKDRIKVFFQLMPATNDGYPVNITGHVSQLANSKRFLITDQNVSYVVNFDQIRYIANL